MSRGFICSVSDVDISPWADSEVTASNGTEHMSMAGHHYGGSWLDKCREKIAGKHGQGQHERVVKTTVR